MMNLLIHWLIWCSIDYRMWLNGWAFEAWCQVSYPGEFIAVGKKLQYVDGSEAMSYIDRD